MARQEVYTTIVKLNSEEAKTASRSLRTKSLVSRRLSKMPSRRAILV